MLADQNFVYRGVLVNRIELVTFAGTAVFLKVEAVVAAALVAAQRIVARLLASMSALLTFVHIYT